MAKETVTQSSRFYCVSTVPDFCKTPVGPATPPLPYTIKGEFKQTSAPSPNVKSLSEPVFLHNKSFIPSVTGDEPGVAKGIKSNTVGKRVESLMFSPTYGSNTTKTIQEGAIVWMNDRNTIGQIHERGAQAKKPAQADYFDKIENKFKETGASVKSSLQSLSGEINQKTKEVGHALTDAGHSIMDQIHGKIEQTRIALQPYARTYQQDISAGLHQFGQDAMATGGKVATGSAGLALAGGAVALTGVGAPVAAGMEVGAAAGGTVAAGVTGVGAAADSGATVLDNVASWVMTGKTPNIKGAVIEIGSNLAERVVAQKLGPLAGKLMPKGLLPKPGSVHPPKPPRASRPPPPPPPPSRNGMKGGKSKPNKKPKETKPPETCPQSEATDKKPARECKSAHYGTGEEILYQTDFELAGELGLAWTRCYRSGSETEDWGILGARWATEYTESLSVCKRGIVFHDETGRSLLLPHLAVGSEFDYVDEGFTLRRDHDDQFTLIWRDGETHTHTRGPNGWLPHGYDGVNMMNKPGTPLLVRRYHLMRKQARDGRGYSVERFHQAQAGEVLLRVRNDDGRMLEAICAPAQVTESGIPHLPLVAQVDEVRPDGTRICQARYEYALEANPHALPSPDYFEAPDAAFINLPPRANLVKQSDVLARSRDYQYRHHLLQRYSNYNGFAFKLDWISLTALRERWQGSEVPQTGLAEHFPLHLANSYQARVIATCCDDGTWRHEMDYQDEDSTRVVEPDGNVFEYHFNHKWLVTRVNQYLPGQTAPQMVGRRKWSQQGWLLEEINAEHFTTRYQYDAKGNLTAEIAPNGNVTRTEYNANNLPVRIINALGESTQLQYDADDRLIAHIDALQRSTRYEYDDWGRLTSVIDGKGGRSHLTYDAAGNLSSHTDCSGYATHYRYDANGNLWQQTNARGETTSYCFDAAGRLCRIEYPDHTHESYVYDAESNLLCHSDAKGQTRRYDYNGLNQPVERIDSNGNRHQYRYDMALRLSELVNGNGEHFRFSYTPQGWLASETGFDGKTTVYQYDAAGYLKNSESGGKKTEFMRDSIGQLIGKTNADGSTRYAYDPLGRLIAAVSPHAENHFRFDPAGQLIEERMLTKIAPCEKAPLPPKSEVEPADIEYAFSLQHQYDELGNRIQTILPNGRTIDTLRYGSGHWHGTLWQGVSIVDLERDALHRETARSMGKHLHMQRSYDHQSRLSSVRFERRYHDSGKLASPDIQQRQYHYDATGNLTHIADNQRGSLHYRYDPLGQLLAAVQPGLAETFAFDPAGNLIDSPLERRKYPRPESSPQIAKVTHNLLQQYCGNLFRYDQNGNTRIKCPVRISHGGGKIDQTFDYDNENRLIHTASTVGNNRKHADYVYDAFNRRIAKRVIREQTDSASGKFIQREIDTTFFVWEGNLLLQEVQTNQRDDGIVGTTTYLYEPDSFIPLAQMKSEEPEEIYARGTVYFPHIADWDLLSLKNTANSHVVDWENFHGEHHHQSLRQQRGEDAHVNRNKDQLFYYQVDHLGTPLELFDPDGVTVWSAKYKAWGEVWELGAEQVKQRIRFQGQYYDEETGLHYNCHRYYDPETGRFLTQDPIGLAGGMNPYRYAPNAIEWVDPLGLDRKKKNSTLLGKNATGCKTWPGKEAHHVIPEDFEDHALLKSINFKMNSGSNAIMLPKSGNGMMSSHNGYHSWYNNAVKSELDHIESKYSSKADRTRAVQDLQRNLDHALRRNKLPLYATRCGQPTGLKEGDWSRYIRSSRRY